MKTVKVVIERKNTKYNTYCFCENHLFQTNNQTDDNYSCRNSIFLYDCYALRDIPNTKQADCFHLIIARVFLSISSDRPCVVTIRYLLTRLLNGDPHFSFFSIFVTFSSVLFCFFQIHILTSCKK